MTSYVLQTDPRSLQDEATNLGQPAQSWRAPFYSASCIFTMPAGNVDMQPHGRDLNKLTPFLQFPLEKYSLGLCQLPILVKPGASRYSIIGVTATLVTPRISIRPTFLP